jgi:hypothetical protein
MPRTLASLALAAVSVSGCHYYASGVRIESPAYVEHDTANKDILVVYVRGEVWQTGNVHAPFDYTVYKYPVDYELKIPAVYGRIDLSKAVVSRCGQEISGSIGSITVEDKEVAIGLQVPLTTKPVLYERVDATTKMVRGPRPPSPCLR